LDDAASMLISRDNRAVAYYGPVNDLLMLFFGEIVKAQLHHMVTVDVHSEIQDLILTMFTFETFTNQE
jgi:hypothetical protein